MDTIVVPKSEGWYFYRKQSNFSWAPCHVWSTGWAMRLTEFHGDIRSRHNSELLIDNSNWEFVGPILLPNIPKEDWSKGIPRSRQVPGTDGGDVGG